MPGLGRLATSSASGSDALMPPYWAIQRPGPLGNLQMAADGIKLAAAGQQLVALRELADDLVGVCLLRGLVMVRFSLPQVWSIGLAQPMDLTCASCGQRVPRRACVDRSCVIERAKSGLLLAQLVGPFVTAGRHRSAPIAHAPSAHARASSSPDVAADLPTTTNCLDGSGRPSQMALDSL